MSTAPTQVIGAWSGWVFRRVDVPAAYLMLAAISWLATLIPTCFGPWLTLPQNRTVFVVAFVSVTIGEVARVRLVGEREAAPMSVACSYAFAFYTAVPLGNPVVYNGREVAAIGGAAMGVGVLILILRGHAVRIDEVAARFISLGVAGVLFRDLPLAGGRSFATYFARHPELAWASALAMLAVGFVTLMVYASTMGTINAARTLAPIGSSVFGEVRALVGLNTALGATGALIAAAALPMGLFAVPQFLIPLFLTLFAVGQHAAVRETQLQTIRVLSRVTEAAGYTSPGHAQRVADLGVAVAIELGMSEAEQRLVEYAALLHDIGQVAIAEPLPRGATVLAAPSDQAQISSDGAAILRHADILPDVAATLLDQATPFRRVRELGEDIPLTSRVIKVVNAYDDFVNLLSAPDPHAAAIERIHLGLGYEYDPRVVDALREVLERRRDKRAAAR